MEFTLKKLIAAVCTVAACGLAAAQQPAKPQPRVGIDTASCAGILDMFAAADPSNNPDAKSVGLVQDRVFTFVVWVNGYLSGRDGVDFTKRPLDQAGVTRLVVDIHRVCSVDESKLFMDAVKELR